MLIEKYMTANPKTIGKNISAVRAYELMKKHGVRRFPVVSNGEIIGIITDSDLRSAGPSQVISFDEAERKLFPDLYDLLKRITAEEIMERDVISIGPDQSVVKAAETMLKNRVSGLPVLDSQKRLVGIITESDIFKVLVDFSGINTGKITLGFRLEDSPGAIQKVVDIIRENDGRVAGIFVLYPEDDQGYRHVYIRLKDFAPEKLEKLKNAVKAEFAIIGVIDDS
ncbi:MAG: CBS and ACT domain-containing protein [Thermodesulfobacteriota bacterium]|nr:CBS and ACT domain-containing protein [Thermodesulfobacteriota bacterium]